MPLFWQIRFGTINHARLSKQVCDKLTGDFITVKSYSGVSRDEGSIVFYTPRIIHLVWTVFL